VSERPTPGVARVTGGTRGFGLRLATVLAEDGWAVAVVGRDRSRAEAVAASLSGDAAGFGADVSVPEASEALVASVTERLGPVDLLVNNAGVRDQRAVPWEADPADWWRTIEINLRGVVLMTSAVLPAMVARGTGRVIDLGSGIGRRAEPRYSAYSVSKAATLSWLDNVAAGLGDDSPVRVVSVSPGLVHTDMTETMWDESDGVEFGPTEPVETFVRRFGAGELDHLHGQFVHAVKDDY
jgi:NAD(P)-dependent dehydrogenase (short-subunit alcohol dehydrogenase family)